MNLLRETAGLILCGGRSSRMGGGDKSLLRLRGSTILARIIERLGPQCRPLAISANGDPARFSAYALPILADTVPGYAGPLAGILAGLEWAAGAGCERLLSTAGDTPFFPADLCARLAEAADAGAITVAASGGRRHPIFALWPVALRDDLRLFLQKPENRRVNAFHDAHGVVEVDFPLTVVDMLFFDPFFNINTPDDLAEAERIVKFLDP